jgi:hypothetical protein
MCWKTNIGDGRQDVGQILETKLIQPAEVTEIKKKMCIRKMEIQITDFRRQRYVQQVEQRKH